MGLLNKMREAIFEEEDTSEATPADQSVKTQKTATTVTQIPKGSVVKAPIAPPRSPTPSPPMTKTMLTTGTNTGVVMPDADIYEKLLAKIKEKTPTVYFQFNDLLSRMSVLPNEADRYRAALAALGQNSSTILNSLAERIKALQERTNEYHALFAREIESSVGDKRQQRHTLDVDIKGLEKHIEEKRQAIAAIDVEIEATTSNLQHEADVFRATAEKVLSELNAEYEQMRPYLQAQKGEDDGR